MPFLAEYRVTGYFKSSQVVYLLLVTFHSRGSSHTSKLHPTSESLNLSKIKGLMHCLIFSKMEQCSTHPPAISSFFLRRVSPSDDRTSVTLLFIGPYAYLTALKKF